MFTPPNMSRDMCHVSRVTCHMSQFLFLIFFSGQIGEAYRWTPCIVPRISGHPHSSQESPEMRSPHQRGRETKKLFFLSLSRLCLKGLCSSSLEILQVCSCADPGSSQLRTHVAKRCCRDFLEVYRVWRVCYQRGLPLLVSITVAAGACSPTIPAPPARLL